MQQTRQARAQRPGLVTFAAVMMFILGGFELTWALVELSNANWLGRTAYGTYGGYLWLWAILDIINAGIMFYAGYDIFRGGGLGRILGLIIACFSFTRWFFLLPVLPIAAIIVMLIDGLIIYALMTHDEYFSTYRSA